MKYLPILNQLFLSNKLVFPFLVLFAILFGVKIKNQKHIKSKLAASILAYLTCEVLANIVKGFYLADFVLLLIGTVVLGYILGFLVAFILSICFRK